MLGFTLSFYKDDLGQTRKLFNTKFGPQWKDRESSYWVRQILAVFWKLVANIRLKLCQSPMSYENCQIN